MENGQNRRAAIEFRHRLLRDLDVVAVGSENGFQRATGRLKGNWKAQDIVEGIMRCEWIMNVIVRYLLQQVMFDHG